MRMMVPVSLVWLVLLRELCSPYYRSSKSSLKVPLSYLTLYSLKSKLSATDTDPNGSDSPSPRNVTGVIVGSVVGGLAMLALIVGGIIFWRRHQRRKHGGYAAGSQESGCFGRKERSKQPEILGEEYNAQPYNLHDDQASRTPVRRWREKRNESRFVVG